jgi:hypothetical protein
MTIYIDAERMRPEILIIFYAFFNLLARFIYFFTVKRIPVKLLRLKMLSHL